MATLSVFKESSQSMDGSLSSVDMSGVAEWVTSPLVEPVTSPLPGVMESVTAPLSGVIKPLSVLFPLSLKPLVGVGIVVVTEWLQVGPSHPASHKQPLTAEQLPCSEQSHLGNINIDNHAHHTHYTQTV